MWRAAGPECREQLDRIRVRDDIVIAEVLRRRKDAALIDCARPPPKTAPPRERAPGRAALDAPSPTNAERERRRARAATPGRRYRHAADAGLSVIDTAGAIERLLDGAGRPRRCRRRASAVISERLDWRCRGEQTSASLRRRSADAAAGRAISRAIAVADAGRRDDRGLQARVLEVEADTCSRASLSVPGAGRQPRPQRR